MPGSRQRFGDARCRDPCCYRYARRLFGGPKLGSHHCRPTRLQAIQRLRLRLVAQRELARQVAQDGLTRIFQDTLQRDRLVGCGHRLGRAEAADLQPGAQREQPLGLVVPRLDVDMQLRRFTPRSIQLPGDAFSSTGGQMIQDHFRRLDGQRFRGPQCDLNLVSVRVPDVLDPRPHDGPLAGPRGVLVDLDRADLKNHADLLDVGKIVQNQVAGRTDDPRGNLHPAHLRVVGEIELQSPKMPLPVADMGRRHREPGSTGTGSLDPLGVHRDGIHAQFGILGRDRLVPELQSSTTRLQHRYPIGSPRSVGTVQPRLHAGRLCRAQQPERVAAGASLRDDLDLRTDRRPIDGKAAGTKLLEGTVRAWIRRLHQWCGCQYEPSDTEKTSHQSVLRRKGKNTASAGRCPRDNLLS